MKTILVSNRDIGRILYPRDNSYAFNFSTNKGDEHFLAGFAGEFSKPCMIVSGPYIRKHTYSFNRNVEVYNEFINVLYEGDVIAVLNCFTEEPSK